MTRYFIMLVLCNGDFSLKTLLLPFITSKGKKNVEADALSRLHKVAEAFANLSFGYAIKTRDEAYALMNEVFEEAPWRKFHQPITFAEIS
jgi:hypothetical protein